MLEVLKKMVFEANMELPKRGLITYTWGNVSARDWNSSLVVIKPSGVSYEAMRIDDMVVVDLDGNVVEGKLRPSSDTPTHLVLYKHYPSIGGIVHTHSTYATAWAQACREIPCYGTTHADYFYGPIACARAVSEQELHDGYEANTGRVITEVYKPEEVLAVPGILCSHHGPFSWGQDAAGAVHNAVVMEEIARMAYITASLNPTINSIPQRILDKHYLRKHGAGAYYGQTSNT